MKKLRSDTRETMNRLLEAASELFAEKGFWETTNADICKKAGVNTASVNYHFGSKENLYVAAWKYSFQKSIQAYPPDGGVGPERPVHERLHGRILSLMKRIADPETYDIEIVHKEMANPTGLLTETLETAITPIDQDLRLIVQELLGDNVGEQQISFCQMSIMGQCFGPMLHLRHTKRAPDMPRGVLPLTFGVEELADHVTRFSLAGIDQVRREAEMNRMSS